MDDTLCGGAVESEANTRLDDTLAWCRARAEVLEAEQVYVYFIAGGSAVKVGLSNDVDQRRTAMQIGNVELLEVLAAVPFGSRSEAARFERECHSRLWASRIRGEWFHRGDVARFLHDGAVTADPEQIAAALDRARIATDR